MMKIARHAKILDLIERKPIETQEELAEELKREGIDVTQATVSRDIKELRLVKVLAENGHYKYAPLKQQDEGVMNRLTTLLKESLVRVDYAGNIVVLKTLSGTAMAAAAAIDALNMNEIVGSIAGDDTIFLLIREDNQTGDVASRFSKYIK
ncbi:MAG: arginine repressor [Thermoanaerobacteraceae bacterium]|nr:arginine repressor [Thermoanaerobacteraceae bacterium]